MDFNMQVNKRAAELQRRVVVLIVLVVIFMTSLILSSYRLGSRMIEVYTPLTDAVMEIQLHATTSHLWFEKLLSNDQRANLATVTKHLDMADYYAELILNGGKYETLTYLPLQDETLRQKVQSVRQELVRFRTIMKKRWAMRATSGPGSKIDQQFDVVFNQLVNETDELEMALQNMTGNAMQRFYFNHLVLLLFAIVIIVTVGWVVRRFLMRQEYNLHLLEQVNHELAQEVEKRRRTEAMLEKQATSDHLTGILNRSRMSALLQEEWNRVVRYREPFSLIMFDIDHFKHVNDRLGHQAGDRVLIELTERVKLELRESDSFARWGGEEFMLLLPQTDLKGAEEVAERCRYAFATSPIQGIGKVTASFGVVSYNKEDDTLEHLLKRADDALYQAKRQGRDRVSSVPESDD
jgi:diguanylate cyclase (GGDEF)-like protein